jgi:hypothetical protein
VSVPVVDAEGEQMVDANGKIGGVTKKQKRIATWIDHCFASHLLLSNHVLCAAGVLGFGKHWHGAKLANSMQSMLCIGIDFGRALSTHGNTGCY